MILNYIIALAEALHLIDSQVFDKKMKNTFCLCSSGVPQTPAPYTECWSWYTQKHDTVRKTNR